MIYKPPSKFAKIEESATLKAGEKAKELQDKGISIWKLDVGEPDFNTPEPIVRAAYEAIKKGMTHYSSTQGLPELRAEIARRSGNQASPSEVIITPGSKQALFYTFEAILDPGDEVIIIEPAWPSYKQMVQLSGGRPVTIDTGEDFQPVLDSVASSLTDRTKAILLNSPNNPTGAVFSESIIKGITDIAKDAKIWVISDEIYKDIVYEGHHVSVTSFLSYDDGLILIDGFSKSYAMTGWRLGYAVAPKPVISQMVKMQGHIATCPAPFTQVGALEGLKSCGGQVREMVAEFARRRMYIISRLKANDIPFVEPKGAFYFFIDLSGRINDGMEPSEFLLERAHVSTTPGGAFGEKYKGFVRLSYASSMKTIEDGLDSIFKATA